ncbi:unnamed protein product [Amoebophrya sp. A25]|nr:unnamed protein product [Amoebophrya sp. A25]|eukprot:GSA25T00000315001.1
MEISTLSGSRANISMETLEGLVGLDCAHNQVLVGVISEHIVPVLFPDAASEALALAQVVAEQDPVCTTTIGSEERGPWDPAIEEMGRVYRSYETLEWSALEKGVSSWVAVVQSEFRVDTVRKHLRLFTRADDEDLDWTNSLRSRVGPKLRSALDEWQEVVSDLSADAQIVPTLHRLDTRLLPRVDRIELRKCLKKKIDVACDAVKPPSLPRYCELLDSVKRQDLVALRALHAYAEASPFLTREEYDECAKFVVEMPEDYILRLPEYSLPFRHPGSPLELAISQAVTLLNPSTANALETVSMLLTEFRLDPEFQHYPRNEELWQPSTALNNVVFSVSFFPRKAAARHGLSEEEFESHLGELAALLLEAGADPFEAREMARQRYGGVVPGVPAHQVSHLLEEACRRREA